MMNEESFCKSGILRPKRTQNDTPIVTLSETKGLGGHSGGCFVRGGLQVGMLR